MSRPTVRDDVALMEGYHSPQVDVRVRLNTNEAPEPPPEEFVEELRVALDTVAWHRYPDRAATVLRARIAETEGDEVDGGITAANVFAANGSNEVLQSLCLAYGGSGRRVATFEPTYALHSHIAKVCGSTVVSGGRHADFTLEVEEARRLLLTERPTITFLCSPNNPTGRLEPEDTVRQVLEVVEEVDGLLVVDEAYGQFSPWSALSLVDEDRPIVVTRTYSKTWSAAALRLGYLIGPTWVVDDLERVVLPYHLDSLTQLAGVLALDHLADMRRRVAHLVEERGRVEAALGDLPVDVWPSAANFILFRPRDRDGADVWQDLVDRGVLVRNCASWPGLEGCLRVTLGTTDEDDEFLAALTAALS
ncbi:histidinol-phosphate transaminase [Dermatobacter hominis]|uniref:histidinol-phosphate transaminase n=1 Tax=Dermatobacter hominis TaxID=2884263 RepID=UPI001D103BA8|nr:histidinol-phosphate transaminase [Dermatobacter hominis]UDY36025.1 histidinol-phosphate transaminase [Dermatobacter hominis]